MAPLFFHYAVPQQPLDLATNLNWNHLMTSPITPGNHNPAQQPWNIPATQHHANQHDTIHSQAQSATNQ